MRWRLVIGLVVTLTVGWSVWWLVGSRMQHAALEDWLAGRRAAGWQAEARDIATAGFPNRFDTRLTDLQLANPRAGWAWRTPFIDVMRLSYDPAHVIVALPGGQTFARPGFRSTLDAGLLRGSLRLTPGTSLPLERLSLEGRDLALRTDDGWRARAGALDGHLAAVEGANTYALFVSAEAVALPDPVRALIDPGQMLAPEADSVVLDARLVLDRRLDRLAVEAASLPMVEAVALSRLEARWGGLAIAMRGDIRADGAGFAAGQLDVEAENWEQMLELGVASGWLGRDVAGALRFGLSLLARNRDGRSVLEVPVVFRDGLTRIGPVPVGPAPRLR